MNNPQVGKQPNHILLLGYIACHKVQPYRPSNYTPRYYPELYHHICIGSRTEILSQYDNYFFIYPHVFCWTICCIVKGSHSFLYIVYSVIQPWLFYKWNAQTRNRKVIMRIECFC